MREDGRVTITPGPPYDGARAYGEDQPPADRRRRRIPLRFRLLAVVVAVVLLATATSDTRSWWAHRVHDITGGSRTPDYLIGLVIGLLPLIGVGLGALGGKDRSGRRTRRLLRMVWFGAIGFVITDLLAPSLGRYATNRSTTRVFDHYAPGYLAGVLTGGAVWLVLFVVAILRARRWWRRVTNRQSGRPGQGPDDTAPSPRVIDI
jgi:membrane protease YdiL (CAAX protease family)